MFFLACISIFIMEKNKTFVEIVFFFPAHNCNKEQNISKISQVPRVIENLWVISVQFCYMLDQVLVPNPERSEEPLAFGSKFTLEPTQPDPCTDT